MQHVSQRRKLGEAHGSDRSVVRDDSGTDEDVVEVVQRDIELIAEPAIVWLTALGGHHDPRQLHDGARLEPTQRRRALTRSPTAEPCQRARAGRHQVAERALRRLERAHTSNAHAPKPQACRQPEARLQIAERQRRAMACDEDPSILVAGDRLVIVEERRRRILREADVERQRDQEAHSHHASHSMLGKHPRWRRQNSLPRAEGWRAPCQSFMPCLVGHGQRQRRPAGVFDSAEVDRGMAAAEA
jgi:hypothetical protein